MGRAKDMMVYLGFTIIKDDLVMTGSFDALKIERKPVVLQRIGLSRSTLQSRIQKFLWCPPIKLDAHAVGFLEHETDELIAAHRNGYSPEQLRELVKTPDSERAMPTGANL